MKKRILATFLSAVTLISCSSALAADYSDVNQSAWYASYVNKISELNAFSGYEDGTFRPDNQITQEEFIKTGKIYLSVLGNIQPPVALYIDRPYIRQ